MLKNNIPSGFEFGIQVAGCHLRADPNLEPFVKENFNAITPGGNFGIRRTFKESDEPDFEITDWVVSYLLDFDIAVKGHCLLHGSTAFARWHNLTNLELEAKLKSSVQAIVDRYRDFIDSWEVLGEVVSPLGGLTNTFWKKRLGPKFAADIYKWVHEVHPHARLYYSDYGLSSPNKRDSVLFFCQSLREQGVELEGLALQFHHYTKGSLNLSGFKKAIRQCFDLGLTPEISEVTIWQDLTGLGSLSDQIQAHCYGKLLDLAIAENVKSFTLWNPFDSYSWRQPEKLPGIIDDDFRPKPAYFELEKILKRWKKKEADSDSQTLSLNISG